MTRKKLDRRALFASGAVAALMAAAGVNAGQLPQRGGKLRLALSGAKRADSWTDGDGLFMQVARMGLVFETLTEIAADGTLRPELAVAWRSSADARIWMFDLRRDVFFHDGVVFSAHDAVHSLAALGDVEALSPNRIQITLTDPDPALPFTLSKPAFVLRAAHAPDAGIGTGLYRVDRFTAGQQLLSTRVEGHWKDGQAGWFDAVELVSIPSETVRAQAVAEYLVDGADIVNGRPLEGFDDIAVWDGHAISRNIALPAALGLSRFDDLRAPQRWWGA
ncbi:MAG: ABC transporter substrate-binding protein [Sulfitobacter sp.]